MTRAKWLRGAAAAGLVGLCLVPVQTALAQAKPDDYASGCRTPDAEDKEIIALMRTNRLTSALVGANNRICRFHERVTKLFADKDPDTITADDVVEYAAPDPKPLMEKSATRIELEALRKRLREEQQERERLRNSNPADEAVRELNEREEKAKYAEWGEWARNANAPPPDGQPVPEPVELPGRQGGFIAIFQGRAKPGAAAAPSAGSVEQMDGEGVLLSPDGVARGNFADGELDGEGEEIRADGTWRVGTYESGRMTGPGVEVRNDNGALEVTTGNFVDDVPDGVTNQFYADGSSRRAIWADGKKVATGQLAAAGKDPETPVYKTPAQLAAEAEQAFLAALDTETNPGELFTMGDSFAENGDQVKARQAWRALIRRFPNSPLAAQAAARLGSRAADAAMSGGGGGGGGASAAPAPAPRAVRARYSSVCMRDMTKLQQRITDTRLDFIATPAFYDSLLSILERCQSFDREAANEVGIKRGERSHLASYRGANPNLPWLQAEARKAVSDPNYSADLGPYRLGPGGVGDGGSAPANAAPGGAGGASYATSLADAILPASIIGRFTGRGLPAATCDDQMRADASLVSSNPSGGIPDQMRQAMAAAELALAIYRQCEGDPAADRQIAYYRQLRATSLDGCRGLSSNPGYCVTPWRN